MLERLFDLKEQDTNPGRETVAGITTFMTMSYIIFVQPAVLSTTGMDFQAVLAATCLVSAIGCFLMAFLANYPIAVAPAMGHNFFFAFTVVAGMGYSWQVALGANCIAGMIFLLLSLVGLRERLLEIMPDSLKHAIATGIGLLIALVGFEWAGLVRPAPGTLVTLGNLHHPVTLLATGGTLLTAILVARGNRGAILIGTVATGGAAVAAGFVPYYGLMASPPSLAGKGSRPTPSGRLTAASCSSLSRRPVTRTLSTSG